MTTSAVEAAWRVADAAIAAAYDESLRAVIAGIREWDSEIEGITSMAFDLEYDVLYLCFETVMVGEELTPQSQIKPGTSQRVEDLLNEHLRGYLNEKHLRAAFDRHSEAGIFWVNRPGTPGR